jgi:hypothetical protein
MSIREELRDQIESHGPDVARSLLDNLPKIIEWLKRRRFDKDAITRDFEQLSREVADEYQAGRARLEAEAADE